MCTERQEGTHEGRGEVADDLMTRKGDLKGTQVLSRDLLTEGPRLEHCHGLPSQDWSRCPVSGEDEEKSE